MQSWLIYNPGRNYRLSIATIDFTYLLLCFSTPPAAHGYKSFQSLFHCFFSLFCSRHRSNFFKFLRKKCGQNCISLKSRDEAKGQRKQLLPLPTDKLICLTAIRWVHSPSLSNKLAYGSVQHSFPVSYIQTQSVITHSLSLQRTLSLSLSLS